MSSHRELLTVPSHWLVTVLVSYACCMYASAPGRTHAQDSLAASAPGNAANETQAAGETLALPPPTAATPAPQQTHELQRRQQLMHRWLEQLDREGSGARVRAAVWGFVYAGLLVSAGVITAFEPRERGDGDQSRTLWISAAFGVGAWQLTLAIISVTTTVGDEDRFARYRMLDQVDAVTLAHFEGELAAEAAAARRRRLFSSAGPIGGIVTGLSLIALTPGSDFSSTGKTAAYIGAGAFIALSVSDLIMRLTGESYIEGAYRAYMAGKAPKQRAQLQVHAAPVIAAGGGGLSLSGSF